MRFFLLLILISFLSASALCSETPKQKVKVNFSQIGRITVSSYESDGGFPKLVVKKIGSRKPIFQHSFYQKDDPEIWKIDKADGVSHPTIHFKILKIKGRLDPLIMITVVVYGGSGGTLATHLIGNHGGKLRLINKRPFLNSYQGGFYVGYLGKRLGMGAAVWNFEWKEGNAHYAYHPYNLEILSFRKGTNNLRLIKKMRTKGTYYYGLNPTGPIREFGIKGNDLLETMPGLENRREW